jgi:hypothetical protein
MYAKEFKEIVRDWNAFADPQREGGSVGAARTSLDWSIFGVIAFAISGMSTPIFALASHPSGAAARCADEPAGGLLGDRSRKCGAGQFFHSSRALSIVERGTSR